MTGELCKLFCSCYPQFNMTPERFGSLLVSGDSHVITHNESGVLTGFVITEGAALRLICVAPEHRHRGIGRLLLSEAEGYIASQGFRTAFTGGVSSRFLIGADKSSWGFFEGQGYTSAGGCDEMLIRLKDFTFDESRFKGHKTARYGWYNGDPETLRKAVAEVDEDWVQYFEDGCRCYAATVEGETASFCLVSYDAQNYLTDAFGRVGMPGCVGTVPKYRGKGIGIELVARVTEHLKNEGMDISFIFFTGVADWYRKLGYEVFVTEVFGRKDLDQNTKEETV